MDTQTIFTAVQNLGAMGILALMVWKSPDIIKAIQSMTENSIKNVRETQSEALAVFKSENDKVIGMVENRFKNVEDVLRASVDTQTEVVGELKTLANEIKNISERVEVIERAKSG